ncbi:hypothetical protein Tco_0874297 [Tanacetum coccineum]|uniref:Uncharacterized protein n=1 Tax=Tanacetum coccineum TaxID=301880 RepID=A0ABQ5BL86_9ASTR
MRISESTTQMIEIGIPCLVTTSFRYILASLSKGSVSLISVKIADLVSWVVPTIVVFDVQPDLAHCQTLANIGGDVGFHIGPPI